MTKIIASLIVFSFCTVSYAKNYTAEECPVVGNTESGIYHVPGKQSYGKMLVENKGKDNRECFKTQDDAKKAGYRIAKR